MNIGKNMTGIADLVRHNYPFLFAWELADKIWLPLLSSPLPLAAGALAGAQHRHSQPSAGPCCI